MRCYFDLGFFISRPRMRTTRQRQRQGQGILRMSEVRLKRRWRARTKSYIDSGLIELYIVFFVRFMYYLEFPHFELGLHDTNTAAETTSTARNTVHYFYIYQVLFTRPSSISFTTLSSSTAYLSSGPSP
jgi:hypothetical protein